MKSIFIIHNSPKGFNYNVQLFYNPTIYHLYLITNPMGLKTVRERDYQRLFERILVTDNYSLEYLTRLIESTIDINNDKFDFITNNEKSISICGKLKKHYKLCTEDYECFVNKITMKQSLDSNIINYPKYIHFNKNDYSKNSNIYINHIKHHLNFPLFIKPINMAGSIGTRKISNIDQLKQWASKAILTPYEYEIDEYINGTLYHCETLLKRGDILFTQVCEYNRPCYEFTKGRALGSITLPHDDIVFQNISEFSRKVHNKLAKNISGVTHLEIFKTKNDKLYFVEITYRTPGILAAEMYTKRLNVSLPEEHFNLQINEEHKIYNQFPNYVARFIYPRRNGKVSDFQKIKSVQSHYQFTWHIKKDEILKKSKRISEHAGTLLLWHTDYKVVRSDFEKLRDIIPFTLI